MTNTTTAQQKLNLVKVLEDIFLVLSPKEKEVIIKRFSLNNEPRQTLEKIGQQFSVTRERIRQIEKIALSKLRRTLENTRLLEVAAAAKDLLGQKGFVCREDELISNILKRLALDSEVDAHIIKLSLHISPEFTYGEKNDVYHPFWRMKHIEEADLNSMVECAHSILSKEKDIVAVAELAQKVAAEMQEKGKLSSKETVASILTADVRFKKVKDEIGLMSWRHINPKSIRDKSYIILKRGGKPLHFVEIANKITEAAFDKKVVTTQAVHNELIRDEHFVLVGRGLYGLKEWGYKKGTVSEVIEDLLRKKSPLTKQEIIVGVLKQRHVKKGTISLNLQKNAHFVRVGRAVYTLDESKKVNG